MEPERSADVFRALNEREANDRPCQRCGAGPERVCVLGYSTVMTSMKIKELAPNFGVACAVLLCANCGNITLHSSELLGLIDQSRTIQTPAPSLN